MGPNLGQRDELCNRSRTQLLLLLQTEAKKNDVSRAIDMAPKTVSGC